MQSPRNELEILCQYVNSYCTQIENYTKQLVSIIKTDLHNNAEHSNSSPPQGGNGYSPVPTLHFNADTKTKFLRNALPKDIFTNLKRISKRWLANIPDEQRKQATKVAQAIAKAVVEGRVAKITEADLARYRTLIQERFGREFNIPTEEIRLAFSQKIRVYLQNTKTKHNKWVQLYEGKINVNDDKITWDDDGEEVESVEVGGNVNPNDNAGLNEASFANADFLRDSTAGTYFDPMYGGVSGVKRSPPETEEEPPAKRKRENEEEEPAAEGESEAVDYASFAGLPLPTGESLPETTE